jgi:hypothetical protein
VAHCFAHRQRRHSDPVFVILDLLRNPDEHDVLTSAETVALSAVFRLLI